MPNQSIPQEEFPPLYTAVGNLVVSWAIAESAISGIITIIYQGAGGKHEVPKLYVAFKSRMKFLRLCFKRIPALEPFTKEGLEIVQMATDLSSIRNFVIHGAASYYDQVTQSYTFTKFDVVDNGTAHEINRVTTTLLDLRGAALDSQNLAIAALALSKRLMDAFVRQ